MGFRDFTLFNQAILGKQGWRLLLKQDSLCAKVMRGKYYPNGNFLSATRKRLSSEFGDMEIDLYGREVPKKGLIKIKRVGPEEFNIWRDHCIPGLPSVKPFSPVAEC
jgi:hypothetical protein